MVVPILVNNLKSALIYKIIKEIMKELPSNVEQQILDEVFSFVACNNGINTNLYHFVSSSIGAMKLLQANGKPNLVYEWSGCLHDKNGRTKMIRMAFGLIEYKIEFFSCTNTSQV